MKFVSETFQLNFITSELQSAMFNFFSKLSYLHHMTQCDEFYVLMYSA